MSALRLDSAICTAPTALAPVTMFADPRFGKIGDEEKAELTALLAFCQRVDAAPSKRPAILAESRRAHAGRTLSEGALRKIYYGKWLATGGDWWALRHSARRPEETAGLPEETRVYWHALVYRMGGTRRAKKAHRELEKAWRRGEKIDGICEAQRGPRRGLLPEGLSYANLMQKKNRPTKLLSTVAGVGLKAAAPHLPGLLTTRVGLPFGSRYVFDDAKHDFEVSVTGQLGGRELWQFHCLELLSAYQVARGYKAAAFNAKTETMEKLKERELLFLLAHLLCGQGYNAEGCILMMERGTATVRSDIEQRLFDYSAGRILVQRGSTSTGSLAPGLYGGQSGGNPRFKAALESLTNLVHIETSDRLLLPAQTGSNARIDRPEELHGRDHHLTQLQKALLAVPPELRDFVRLPTPPLWQAIAFADAAQEAMNWRTDHELEGWERCGFVMPEYRLHEREDFQAQTALMAMEEPLRAAITAAIRTNPKLTRTRRLSPGEVFTGYAPTLTRLPAHVLPALVGLEHAKEKRVGKDGDWHFEDEDVGPDEHHYSGVVTDAEGRPTRLQPGEKYAVFVSAIDPSRLYACDAQGRFIGWAERLQLPSKADAHGFARAAGRRMAAHQELLAPVLAAARPLWKRMMQDADVNDTVFARALGARIPHPKPLAAPTARNADLAQQFAAQAAATIEDEENP